MDAEIEQALLEFVDQNAQLVVLVFDSKGGLLKTNRFARRALGPGFTARDYQGVFLDFNGSLDWESLARPGRKPVLLHLHNSQDNPQSFSFSFTVLPDAVLAVGQHDPKEIELLRTTLLDITGELSNLNRSIQKKNHELSRLNDLKNQFIGMAAHDLRNPLGHIRMCSRFLLEDTESSLGETQRDFLNIISNSSLFMLDMINDILDISAIEAGRLQLKYSGADLYKLIRQSISFNSHAAQKRGQEIILNLNEGPCQLKFDENKIRQVLDNLLSNAMRYSPEKTRVTVSAFTSDSDVIVSVSDQGAGIPDDELNQLFKPFHKTSVQTADGSKSTGLGLAIVHRIVHGHKGRIWVESKPDQGSTFYFSLPLHAQG